MVTFEIARRCVQLGDSVEWFSASFPGAPADELLDGVRIVRRGHQWTVHWRAFRRYRGRLRQNFDVVIDEVNTIPFFTPLWAGIPSVMFIHQLAREVWWYESDFPLNLAGFLAEPIYLRPYRSTPTITVSTSTSKDLRGLGFTGPITVIPQGVEAISDVRVTKAIEPTFLYVGRLAPSKRVADIVRAFAAFVGTTQRGDLYLLGDGPSKYVNKLQSLAYELAVAPHVHFLGHVSTVEKHQAMARASALLMASVREGWGLVVTEANSLGTPAIGYDVPGLRDSIRHNETGLLVRPSPQALADAMVLMWRDRDLNQRLARSAAASSATLSFENTAAAFREAIGAKASPNQIQA